MSDALQRTRFGAIRGQGKDTIVRFRKDASNLNERFSMRFKTIVAEEALEYIDRVRRATVDAIGLDALACLVDPLPHAVYILAIDKKTDAPCGLTESHFWSQVADKYEELPFNHLTSLEEVCHFDAMCHIRTIFIEPSYRHTHCLFLQLCLCSAYIFRTLGATYSSALTNPEKHDLGNLYHKLGGQSFGAYHSTRVEHSLELFLFDLEKLVRHRWMDRVIDHTEVNFEALFRARRRGPMCTRS